MTDTPMLRAARRFQLQGKVVSCEPYGEGHINRTYLLITENDTWYILQQINHRVFLDVPALMGNIGRVTRHLAQDDPEPRHTLTIVNTLDNLDFYRDEEGDYWRVYVFVRQSLCLQSPRGKQDFYQSGYAFGRFQNRLTQFDAASLHETIPNFHNTPSRCEKLKTAVAEDVKGRLRLVRDEVDFAMARVQRAGRLQVLQRQGRLKTRVTHNDTKLNNVLLNEQTGEALCVIDLDTVMPGLAAHDFGDSIRFGASTAKEDEQDLSRVSLSLPMYEAYAQGFLKACCKSLLMDELRTLPEGAWAMTYECGIRFLTDYLQGDVYFRIHREHHNLDRCRTQFKLVRDMEDRWEDMERILLELL